MDETKTNLIELLKVKPSDLNNLNNQQIFNILANAVYVQENMIIAFMSRLGIDPEDTYSISECSAAFPVYAAVSNIMESCIKEIYLKNPELVNNDSVAEILGKLPEVTENEKIFEGYNIAKANISFMELFAAITEQGAKRL